ncbi:MAG: type I-E CRISPR-associated protein Cas7/Cse4/CasC [Bacillota bacterium]
MLIEIHMLQNHAPSNLNRDDTGSPKDCIFGGVRRARISSQALKRSIRRSDLFQRGLQGVELALRTRQLPDQVHTFLLERGLSEEMAAVGAAKASGFGNKDGKEHRNPKTKEPETAQIMFLTPEDIQMVADVIYEAAVEAGTPKAFEKVEAKDLQDRAAKRGWRPMTPDIALFGRMITSDAFRDVEASVQVAHALSTHKMEHEFDYFTAVDDLLSGASEDEKGAGMIGDVEFNSACYYKYFSLDVENLVENLVGKLPERATPEERTRQAEVAAGAAEIARHTVLAFLAAAAFTTPSGKQNSFAAHQLPDAILVEARAEKVPVSYANAFVKPVSTRESQDLVDESLARFTGHVELLTRKFSLKSVERFWFTTRNAELKGATVCETFDDLLGHLSSLLEGRLAHG